MSSVKTKRRQTAGFTLIEIVMVLLVLSILGAVAVPKYFDMREKAETEKCHYHRALVEKTLHERSSLEVNDVMSLTTAKFSVSVYSAMNEVMAELGGSGCHLGARCEKLCPIAEDGYAASFAINDDGTYKFVVACSEHDKGRDLIGTQVGTQSNAKDLMNWLVSKNEDGTYNYEAPLGDSQKSLDNFFTVYEEKGHSIDSEAMELNGSYSSEYVNLPKWVNQALLDGGLDLNDVVWNLSRNQLTSDPSSKYYEEPTYWHSQLVLTMADKSAPVGADGKVTTTVVSIVVEYYRGTGNKVLRFFDQDQKTGTATLVTDSSGITRLVPD